MVSQSNQPETVSTDTQVADASFRPSQVTPVTIDDLAETLDGAGYRPHVINDAGATVATPQQVTVQGISMDSRTVGRGDLYVGVPGARHHGATYAADALAAGAVAVLTDQAGAELIRDHGIDQPVPVITVESVRDAIGPVAQRIYNTDSSTGAAPTLYGVTGTNGKTTTTYMLESILDRMTQGGPTGLIGTVETRIGDSVVPSNFTTPEAPQLHGLMARMAEYQVPTAAMEVSSHALDYRRTAGLRFAVAGFTNLTQDHLDLHGTMEAYAHTKAQLFTPDYSDRAVITLNGGPQMEWGAWMFTTARAAYEGHLSENQHDHPIVSLDLGPAAQSQPATDAERALLEAATWRVAHVRPAGLGSAFALHHQPSGLTLNLMVGLPGAFNIANAALAAAMIFEVTDRDAWEQLGEILNSERGPLATVTVPGRMEVVSHEPTVIVDFAHNPDGMVQALRATHQLLDERAAATGGAPGRTILVFGATGDRDTSKRAIMGRIAVQESDIVIVSDDDPHTEDPAQIRAMVVAGAHKEAQHHASVEVHEIAPREEALRQAVEWATADDVILAAGRGHETHQDLNGRKHAIDDREVLRAALNDNGWTTNTQASRFEFTDTSEPE